MSEDSSDEIEVRDRDSSPSSTTGDENGGSGNEGNKRRKRKRKAVDARKAKRSRRNGKVLERLTEQVSGIDNYLSNLAFPPMGWYPPDYNGTPCEPEVQTEESVEPALRFDFELAANLKEQTVANASSEHLHLLRTLQHFKAENWTNVHYSDIQKSYTARPGIVDLEVNDEIKQFQKPVQPMSLGAITRAVIMQSDALKKRVSDLLQWSQESSNLIKEAFISKIKETFSGDFQRISLDCLQLVCGRRADIIEQRRDAFISLIKDNFLKASLKKIERFLR
ncbi:Uncharacterized protein OBRU01_23232, partial [Operophtera brumata]